MVKRSKCRRQAARHLKWIDEVKHIRKHPQVGAVVHGNNRVTFIPEDIARGTSITKGQIRMKK
jgi:hypothetical protein